MGPSSVIPNGLSFNFWAGGMTVYGVCVLVVNAVLLKMINSYTGYCEAMIFAQCSLFWIVCRIENDHPMFTGLYKLWYELLSSPAAWLGTLLVVMSVFSVDLIARTSIYFVETQIKNEDFSLEKNLMFKGYMPANIIHD